LSDKDRQLPDMSSDSDRQLPISRPTPAEADGEGEEGEEAEAAEARLQEDIWAQDFDTSTEGEIEYCTILNRVLPKEIRALAWVPVPPGFNARFCASSRTYRYFFSAEGLDVTAMAEAAKRLVGEHDFRNLCKIDVTKTTNYRSVGVEKVSFLAWQTEELVKGEGTGLDGFFFGLCYSQAQGVLRGAADDEQRSMDRERTGAGGGGRGGEHGGGHGVLPGDQRPGLFVAHGALRHGRAAPRGQAAREARGERQEGRGGRRLDSTDTLAPQGSFPPNNISRFLYATRPYISASMQCLDVTRWWTNHLTNQMRPFRECCEGGGLSAGRGGAVSPQAPLLHGP
jgi:hypothetical protein